MHSSYYNDQILSKLDTIAGNVDSGPSTTGDVNVTNTSLDVIVTNTPTVNATCSGSVSITGTTAVSGAVTVSSGSITANCSGSVSITGTTAISGAVTVTSGSISAIITNPALDVLNSHLTDLGACVDTVNHRIEMDVTAINGNLVDAGSGIKSTGSQRVTIANDDTNLKAISNFLCDFRYFPLNTTPEYSKFTKVQAKINPVVFPYPTSGFATIMNNTGVSQPTMTMVTDSIVTLPNSPIYITVFPAGSINYSLPFDTSRIGCMSANDATAGSYARQVNLVYRDNNDVLQNVTHNLSNTGTTYNIRRLINFEVVSWGGTANFNEDTIYLQQSTNSRYMAWIHPHCNQSHFTHISIPYLGFVAMDNIIINQVSSGQATLRILLWKQTSTSNYVFSTVFEKSLNGVVWFNFDLSYLPIIYGPTSLTENWGLVIVSFSSGASVASMSAELNAKIKTF